jgi:hypothetical protein
MSTPGVYGGSCYTPGCEATGVSGIVGPAWVYGSGTEMNSRHRCDRCRDLIHALIGSLPSATLGLPATEWAEFERDLVRNWTAEELPGLKMAVIRRGVD